MRLYSSWGLRLSGNVTILNGNLRRSERGARLKCPSRLQAGPTAVKFTATKGWSISIDYPGRGDSKRLVHVSPMSGGAGDNEITITAAQNETSRIVRSTSWHSGSASKVYKVTMPAKNELAAEVHEFKDLSYEEQIIEVPLVSNVEQEYLGGSAGVDFAGGIEGRAGERHALFQDRNLPDGASPRETSITLTNTPLGLTSRSIFRRIPA